MYRVKTPKPLAILSLIIGIGMVILVWTSFEEAPIAFKLIFSLIAIGGPVVHLWSAYHPKGSIQNVERDPNTEITG